MSTIDIYDLALHLLIAEGDSSWEGDGFLDSEAAGAGELGLVVFF